MTLKEKRKLYFDMSYMPFSYADPCNIHDWTTLPRWFAKHREYISKLFVDAGLEQKLKNWQQAPKGRTMTLFGFQYENLLNLVEKDIQKEEENMGKYLKGTLTFHGLTASELKKELDEIVESADKQGLDSINEIMIERGPDYYDAEERRKNALRLYKNMSLCPDFSRYCDGREPTIESEHVFKYDLTMSEWLCLRRVLAEAAEIEEGDD